MKPLAITGVGAVVPQAEGREGLRRAFEEGISSFGSPTLFDAAAWPGAWVSEVRDFDPTKVLGDKGLRNLDRLTRLFLVAGRQALENAGLKRDGQWLHYSGPRAGVCASTAYGSLEAMTELHRVAVLENPRYLNPSKFPNTVINSALGYVSIWEDLRALNATVCNGNCGALDVVLVADMHLSSGRADVLLMGGAEALHEALYLAFDRLGYHATEHKKYLPGDTSSEGLRLGEGAVLLVLESEQNARQRGAKIDALVVGYGTSFEPPEREVMLVHVVPSAVERAIRIALQDAQLNASDIDAVALSACGVRAFDAAERIAIEKVFGSEGPTLAAPKQLFGETFGASGAIGMAGAISWLNGVEPSPVCAQGRRAQGSPIKNVLVTTVGFYGNASAVILRSANANKH